MKLYNTVQKLIASIRRNEIETSLYGRMYAYGYDESIRNVFSIEASLKDLKVSEVVILNAKAAYAEGFIDADEDLLIQAMMNVALKKRKKDV